MDGYRLLLASSSRATKVLLTHGQDELLRAVLPPPSEVRHQRAAITLIEGLSLWLDTTLPVAVCVDDREASSCLGLADEMGLGLRSVFCRIEVVEHKPGRRRPGIRIRGIGDFRDMRQLRLWCLEGEPSEGPNPKQIGGDTCRGR
jgi:hypothetical protein